MHVVPRSDVYSGIDAKVLSNMGHGFSTPDAKQVHQEDSLPLVSESRDSSRRPDFATQMEVSYFINGYSSRYYCVQNHFIPTENLVRIKITARIV